MTVLPAIEFIDDSLKGEAVIKKSTRIGGGIMHSKDVILPYFKKQ